MNYLIRGYCYTVFSRVQITLGETNIVDDVIIPLLKELSSHYYEPVYISGLKEEYKNFLEEYKDIVYYDSCEETIEGHNAIRIYTCECMGIRNLYDIYSGRDIISDRIYYLEKCKEQLNNDEAIFEDINDLIRLQYSLFNNCYNKYKVNT